MAHIYAFTFPRKALHQTCVMESSVDECRPVVIF